MRNIIAYLFLIVGLIDILWAFIFPRIGVITIYASDFDIDLYERVYYAFGLASWFLGSIPYGFTFIIIGFKNLRNYEIFLKISGLFLIIGGILSLSTIAIIEFPLVFEHNPLEKIIVVTLLIIFYLGVGFNVLASTLLLIYAIKIPDIQFGGIALLFLFEWIISFILYFYELPIIFL